MVAEHLPVDVPASQPKVLPTAVLALSLASTGASAVWAIEVTAQSSLEGKSVLAAPLFAAVGLALMGLLLTWVIKYHVVNVRRRFAEGEEKARLAAQLEERVHERTGELREREERFWALTELSSDWYWQTDQLGQFTAMSHGVSRFGRDPAEFIGRRRSEFAADPGDQHVRAYEALLAARQSFRDLPFVVSDANGSRRQVRLNGEPFYGDDGAFAGFRGSGRDVTEEVEARAALASREALLATVYESVVEGIAAFGPDMRVLAWNKRYENLHGFPPFLLHVGTAFIDLARFHAEGGQYGPGDREELVDARLALIDLERPQDFERVRPQGTVLEVRSRPMAGGGIVLTYLDVTAARRREAEKEQARATLRGVFDGSLNGIMAFDALRSQDGKIRDFRWTQVNPACVTLTGRDANELVGRYLLEEMPGDRENGLFARYCDVVEKRLPAHFEHHRADEGMNTWFRIQAVPLDDGLVVTFSDVTLEKTSKLLLELSETRLTAIFDTVGVGIVVIDELDRITMVNPTAERLFGWSAAELIGREANGLISDLEETDLFAVPSPSAARRSRESTAERRDGTTFPADISVGAFRAAGRTFRVAAIADLSVRNRALVDAQQAREQLEAQAAERAALAEDLDQAKRRAEAASAAK